MFAPTRRARTLPVRRTIVASGLHSSKSGSNINVAGRYVFDLRNESLRQWMLDVYIGGPLGMGHKDVSGMFLVSHSSIHT